MQLVYTITLYKQPEQFAWLWRVLYNRHDGFVLHVDRKTPDDVYRRFHEIAGDAPNIHWLTRQSVVWMGPGLVDVELQAIGAALQKFKDFDYLINLSGQDFPLRHRDDIVAELETRRGANYISMEALATLPFHIRRRPHLVTLQIGDRLIKTPLPRPIPSGLQIRWKGSWWHVLDREFCRWVAASPKASAYQRFLRHVQVPDELYFQNVIMDSPFAATVADRNRTFVKWSGQGGSPDTLGMADHDTLLRSSMFFARKFDATVDGEILQKLATSIS